MFPVEAALWNEARFSLLAEVQRCLTVGSSSTCFLRLYARALQKSYSNVIWGRGGCIIEIFVPYDMITRQNRIFGML